MHTHSNSKFKNTYLHLTISFVLFCSMLLASCGGGNGGDLPPVSNKEVPIITSTVPANGVSSVAVDTEIKVTFDRKMNLDSAGWFKLDNGVNGIIIVANDSLSATFRPEANLAPSKTYTATLLTNNGFLKDTKGKILAGNSASGNYLWAFTTAAANTSGTGPIMEKQLPQPTTVDVPVDTAITVSFDKDMNQNTISSLFKLSPTAGSSTVAGALTYPNPKSLNFKPNIALSGATEYTVTLANGTDTVTDTSGQVLQGKTNWKFTTLANTAPSVTNQLPAPNTTAAAAGLTIKVTFGTSMDSSNVNTWLTMTDAAAGATAVTGTSSYDGPSKTLTFTPGTGLVLSGKTYNIKLNTATKTIKDLNGTPLPGSGANGSGDISWQIMTSAAGQNTTPPTITQQLPAPSSTVAASALIIELTFSKPMNIGNINNWLSITQAGTAVTGTAVYNAQTNIFTFTPIPGSIQSGATYDITLKTANNNILDSTGTPLAGSPLATGDTVWQIMTTNTGPISIPPTIVQQLPPANSTVPTSGLVIEVKFSKTMNSTGFSTWLTMADTIGGVVVTGTSTYNAALNTLVFTPDPTSLQSGITYDITLKTANSNIMDTTGAALDGTPLATGDTVWQIMTSTAPVNVPPIITQQYPADLATAIPVASLTITVTFSQAMNSTNSGSWLTVADSLGAPVVGVSGYDPTLNTLSFTPNTILANTIYNITLNTANKNITDATGVPLDGVPIATGDTVWSFTTETTPGPVPLI